MATMNDILRGARLGVTAPAGIPDTHRQLNTDIRTAAAAGRQTVEVRPAAGAAGDTPTRLQAPSALLADLRAQAAGDVGVTAVTGATQGESGAGARVPPGNAGAWSPVQVAVDTMNDHIRQAWRKRSW